jgi:hypothetical protein
MELESYPYTWLIIVGIVVFFLIGWLSVITLHAR